MTRRTVAPRLTARAVPSLYYTPHMARRDTSRLTELARSWLQSRRLAETHLDSLVELLATASARKADRYSSRRAYHRDYQRGAQHARYGRERESGHPTGAPDYRRDAYLAGYDSAR